MAQKRRIMVEREREPDGEKDIPERFKDSSWSEWARGTYARWWYGLLCLFIDVMVALELSAYIPADWSIPLLSFTVLTLIIIEIYIYRKVWGGLDFLFER
jgi:hypothetical protein